MEEEKPQPIKKQQKLRIKLFLMLALLVLVFGFGIFKLITRDTGPIPKDVKNSVKFAVYYPTGVPAGYKLNKSSVKNANGIVFYTFVNGSNSIYVTQQAAPPNPPDLKKLTEATNFKKLDTDTGNGVIGLDNGKPTSILLTNTTLINVNAGNKNIPSDTVLTLTKSLHSL